MLCINTVEFSLALKRNQVGMSPHTVHSLLTGTQGRRIVGLKMPMCIGSCQVLTCCTLRSAIMAFKQHLRLSIVLMRPRLLFQNAHTREKRSSKFCLDLASSQHHSEMCRLAFPVDACGNCCAPVPAVFLKPAWLKLFCRNHAETQEEPFIRSTAQLLALWLCPTQASVLWSTSYQLEPCFNSC